MDSFLFFLFFFYQKCTLKELATLKDEVNFFIFHMYMGAEWKPLPFIGKYNKRAELELLSKTNKATGKTKQERSLLFYGTDRKEPKCLLVARDLHHSHKPQEIIKPSVQFWDLCSNNCLNKLPFHLLVPGLHFIAYYLLYIMLL